MPTCLQVNTEHILLGLIAEDPSKTGFLGSGVTVRRWCRGHFLPARLPACFPQMCLLAPQSCLPLPFLAPALSLARFPGFARMQIDKARIDVEIVVGKGRREPPKDLPFRWVGEWVGGWVGG